MQRRVQDGFSILLPAEDALRVFREKIKISCIAAVPQTHRLLQLIINLLAQPDRVKPSVNNNMYREIAPESMQFGQAFLRILQGIWDSDLGEGPVQVSKLNVTTELGLGGPTQDFVIF